MDSNRKHIDFRKLFHKQENVTMYKGATIESASHIFNMECPDHNAEPTDIVFHVGTNDTDSNTAEHNAQQLIALSEQASRKFPNARVHVSELTPRGDEMHDKVKETNTMLRNHNWHQNVQLIKHMALTSEHLHDDRHLAYWYNSDDKDQMSGSMWLAAELFRSIINFMPSKLALMLCRLRRSDLYPVY